MAASEMTPFAKTGGLADVLGALPYALAKRGHQVSVFIPHYRCLEAFPGELILQQRLLVGARAVRYGVLCISSQKGVRVYTIRKDEYFDRSFLYGIAEGDYDDNAERYIFFSKAVVHATQALGLNPDIVHAHDWQTALIPLYVNLQSPRSPARTLYTIHNLAYQGVFDSTEFSHTNLSSGLFSPSGLEFYGRMNLMKGGILFANAVTTVSRRYAYEIQSPEYGCALEGVIRSRQSSLYGIMNGADYSVWNPETDSNIAKKYTPATVERKQKCREALQNEMDLEITPRKPIFGMVTRFAQQKGIDILLRAFPEMFQREALFVILGNGDLPYEEALAKLAKENPHVLGLKLGFEEGLSHRVYAGCDFLMMPSLYEPCGLSQLYAMRYGTIPVVRATGGLDDSVEDWDHQAHTGTGFKFVPAEPASWLEAMDRAIATYKKPKAMATLRQNAMAANFSWDKSASEYENLYNSLHQHA